MAGLPSSLVSQLNAAGNRSRSTNSRTSTTGPGASKGNPDGLMKLATALASGSAAANADPLASPQKKLNDSIRAIMQSNAPGGYKNSAAQYSTEPVKKDKSLFDQVKDVLGTGMSGVGQLLSLPETLVTQPIRRLIDPNRNLLKDITSGETTSSALAKADWFKSMPMPVKIAGGIAADIATDPLTYLLGSGVVTKLGQAAGIISKIEEASVALRAAGKLDDAERLLEFGGNLARKGKGGLGGIKNADLAWIGTKLEETGVADLGGKTLKGGIYLQAPGTGRVGDFVAKKLTGSGIDSAKYQLYLGRGPVVEKVSAGLNNAMSNAKTSKLLSVLGDTYGGGEGKIKRAILNADTPQEALNLRRVLVSERLKNGSEAVFTKMMERKQLLVSDAAKEAKVDPSVVAGALDGNVDDIARLNAARPGLFERVREFDTGLLTDSRAQLERVVKNFGGTTEDLQNLASIQESHFHGTFTQEAYDAMAASKGAKKFKSSNNGIAGFMHPARFVPGADHLGTPIAHSTDTLTRAVWQDPKTGLTHVLLGDGNKPAVAMAAEHGVGADAERVVMDQLGPTISNNSRAAAEFGTDGPVVKAKFLDQNGDLVDVHLPVDQVKFQEIAPNGLGAKTQVNAVHRNKYNYDLFDTNYESVVQKQIREVSKALGKEVQGQYLKRFGLAASKGEDATVAQEIAKSRGISVSADAAAEPAFQTAVVANVDDPAKVQVASIAANGMADARTSLPTEPAGFSILSLSPQEAQVHIDGVLEDVQAQAEVLASRSGNSRPNSVKHIAAAVERTKARLGVADEHLAKLDQLISDAKQMNASGIASGADQLEVSQLEAVRDSILVTKQADTDAVRLLAGRQADEAQFKAWMFSPEGQQGFSDLILEGWTGISRSIQTPDQVFEAMAMLTKATGPDQLPGMFRYFDKLTSLFKSWAIASPGFVMRNMFGGMFNNYLIGVDAGRYLEFMKADRAFMKVYKRTGDVEQALAAVPERLNAQYRLLHSSGVLAETDRISDAAFGLQRGLGQGVQKRDALGFLGNNPVTRGVYDANSRMERVLRGAAGMDAAAKTNTLDGIYESVFKAHFDYADLNRFEVNWMKRVSPFYTWTRKNLPLQMEMLFRNPKAYNRYNIFKRNIESVTPAEDLVPAWMRDRLNIRLPFTSKDGQSYLLPDLPFTSLNMFTNADELAGQINPLIKLPAEMMMDRKLYFGKSAPFAEGYVQMPDILTKTGIAQAMSLVGLAEQDINGNYMTRDKTLYAAEQFLPFFGKMRRLLPSEKKYDERAVTTWLNFLFGTGLRTNTMTDKSSELYFRQRSVDQIAKDLNSLGYGGYTYWSKRVETSRKPTSTDKRPYLSLNQPKGGLGFDSPYTNVSGSRNTQAISQALASLSSRN